ncbi:MAG: ABC transporter substrate-binding protein, partial [Armatimonadota bacterium]|nr:ABC transporter substrate-binding protein [Armatimonadota bacterium]
VLAALAALCLAAAIAAAAPRAAAKKPYRIGAVFDITGPASPLGTPERDTVKMIAEQLKKSGGINGHPVEFIIYDNGSEETKCVMAVKRLIENDKVAAIIGPSQTGTTLAVAPMCEKARIPLVSCAAGVKITDPVKPFIFKTAQSDVHAVAKLIDYLKAKGLKKIAFINVANAFGASGRQQMELQAKTAGIELVALESFGDKDTDMTAQLTRIKARAPQAVVCWGTNPGPAIVARNMRQLDLDIPLLMSHGIANRKFIELAGEAAEGVVFPAGRLIVAGAIPDTDRQKKTLLGFASQFRQMYGRDADTFGGHAWDAAKLVLRAMEKVGDDPVKIRAELERTRDFVGISGIFNFSPKEHNGLTKDAFVMVTIRNGAWALVK